MLPIIALVGRPNVGKSTLFNGLTGRRDALVVNQPGVTRDRHYGTSRLGKRPWMVIDTGGLTSSGDAMDELTGQQVRMAIDEADLVVFMTDARQGVQVDDHTILGQLRRTGKPLLLAVNKVDGLEREAVAAEFSALGVNAMLTLSASHRRGLDRLVGEVEAQLPPAPPEPPADHDPGIPVAILGRPNAGKSTLVNRLLGEDRQVVSEVAGTTRDAIRVPLERDGQRYTLIDTAGIRRRTRRAEAVEKFSIIQALRAIEEAEVVVLLVDARENLAEQDLSLIGHALDAGRALVVAVNKWDGLDAYAREQCRQALDRRLVFVPWAPRITLSALHGSGLAELMQAIGKVHRAASRKLSTSELSRAVEAAYEATQPPLVRGHAPKLRYAHSAGSKPPTIVIHGSRTKHLAPNYKRYLENFMRKRFQLDGTPIRLVFRDGDNPYAGRKNTPTARQTKKRQRMIRHRRGH